MPAKKDKSLDIKELRRSSDPNQFSFDTTDDLPDLVDFIGQNRALSAVHVGIGIKRDGFNIFALGPTGVGKRSVIRSLLQKEAKTKPSPPDICYIHNFKDPRHPSVLLLKPGLGKRLADDMNQLIEILKTSIPAIFESAAYIARIKEIQEEARNKQEKALAELEEEAERVGVAILRTGQGFMLAATKNKEIISEKDFAALPKEEREAKDALMQKVHERLTDYLEQMPGWQKEQRDKVKEAFKYFTMLQVGSAIDDAKKRYRTELAVTSFLDDVKQVIIENPMDFRKRNEAVPSIFTAGIDESVLNRYRVNVVVDNSQLSGAPIVYEDNPTFSNLVGRIEHVSHFGALVTDFTLIRAGALQKANGGYLLLDALKLLKEPFAWDYLKRTLRAKEIKVENIQQLMGLMTTVSLEPDPLPFDQKVVLLGDRYIYYLLCALDPDFLALFKIAADFDEDIKNTQENNLLFAQLLKSLVKKDELRPLSREAVAEVIDYSARVTGDREKISTHVRPLCDLIREADHCASLRASAVIEAKDVETAAMQQDFRASRIKERQLENISRGKIFIDTAGSFVGQINGLAYVLLGDFAFGHPVKITARAAAGGGELVDIEREVKLSGPIHSKGVLILTGYVRGQFGKDAPLSLSASLVFEQSYSMVDGDSASLAEACVLLSAISGVPIKQSIAITGSMNQHGKSQPIGGVNEKIESFYDVCAASGLTGEHAVIIPKANIESLMLKKEVVDAAKKGLFTIYAVETIDDAIEILCGQKAGVRDAAGSFPKASINGKVEAALENFAKSSKAHRSKKKVNRQS